MTEEIIKTESALEDEITDFLKMYKKNDEYKYVEKIDGLLGSNVLLNYYDFFEYDQEKNTSLLKHLTNNPQKFFHYTKNAIKRIYADKHGKNSAKHLDLQIQVDLSELVTTVNQAIKKKFLNKLVSIEGRIHGEGNITPRILSGYWLCERDHETKCKREPSKCSDSNCNSNFFTPIAEKTETEYFRTFYVRSIDYGNHSDTLVCEALGDFTESVRTGDTVKLVGYVTLEKRDKKLFNVFHIHNITKVDEVNYEITPEEQKIFDTWPQQENFYLKLINSVSPNIYGQELLKESFLLSYVGAPKWHEDQRNWINTLAVGDPATAKSQIERWAQKKLPYVHLISSKAGSAKGVFAGQQEQVDGKKVLEVGPMVTCSGRGLVCIDEFVKSPEIFNIFLSPMEDGIFHSSTVGGHVDLPCETPVYATGNPDKSNKWDEDKSILKNLDVMDTALLSRFDLIVITKDDSDIEERKKIAYSVLGMQNEETKAETYLENDFVKFLLYAKTIHPELTQEVADHLVTMFTDILQKRRLTEAKDEELNNRLINTLTKITLAIARCHLHRQATIEDVSSAYSLIERILKQRGIQTSNIVTYVETWASRVISALEDTASDLTDFEIYDGIKEKFSEYEDELKNDVGTEPIRSKNRAWRAIMQRVEQSQFTEVTRKKNPRKLRYKRTGQTTIQQHTSSTEDQTS